MLVQRLESNKSLIYQQKERIERTNHRKLSILKIDIEQKEAPFSQKQQQMSSIVVSWSIKKVFRKNLWLSSAKLARVNIARVATHHFNKFKRKISLIKIYVNKTFSDFFFCFLQKKAQGESTSDVIVVSFISITIVKSRRENKLSRNGRKIIVYGQTHFQLSPQIEKRNSHKLLTLMFLEFA